MFQLEDVASLVTITIGIPNGRRMRRPYSFFLLPLSTPSVSSVVSVVIYLRELTLTPRGNACLISIPERLAFCVMSGETPQNLVEEGILEFTLGDSDTAISKLKRALELDGRYFDAWLALAEVHLSRKSLDEALEAAEMAHQINPDDLHINTSLSRIWVEHGNVERAEHFAAQVRLISWKKELKGDPP